MKRAWPLNVKRLSARQFRREHWSMDPGSCRAKRGANLERRRVLKTRNRSGAEAPGRNLENNGGGAGMGQTR